MPIWSWRLSLFKDKAKEGPSGKIFKGKGKNLLAEAGPRNGGEGHKILRLIKGFYYADVNGKVSFGKPRRPDPRKIHGFSDENCERGFEKPEQDFPAFSEPEFSCELPGECPGRADFPAPAKTF